MKGGNWTNGIYKDSTETNPLVSIITVTFNASLHLRQSLESIVSQTYGNIELILIDGGSKDSTLDIIIEFGGKIDYWQSEPDLGIYDAMNKGLMLARGKWIGFKNADDWYTPDAIQQFVTSTKSIKADVWYGNSYSVIQESPLSCSPFFTDHKTLGRNPGIDHRSSFVLTSFHQKIQFNLSYKLAADLDVFWRLKLAGARFSHIPHFLAYKRFGGASDGTKIMKETFRINRIHQGIYFALVSQLKVRLKYLIWKTSNFILKFILGQNGYNAFKARKLNRK